MQKTLTKVLLALSVVSLISSCFGYTARTFTYPLSSEANYKRAYPVKNWKNLEIYNPDELNTDYKEIASIVVVGGEYSSLDNLYNKMRRAAGLYNADAIILTDQYEIEGESFDGFAATANIITAFSDTDECDDYYLDTGGIYTSFEIRGIAIKFLEEKDN